MPGFKRLKLIQMSNFMMVCWLDDARANSISDGKVLWNNTTALVSLWWLVIFELKVKQKTIRSMTNLLLVSSGVQIWAESAGPCGPPSLVLLSGGTVTADYKGGPDKAVSVERHCDKSLKEKKIYDYFRRSGKRSKLKEEFSLLLISWQICTRHVWALVW